MFPEVFIFFLLSGDECLTLARKGRCQNQLKRRQAGPERLLGNGHSRLAGGGLRSVTITTSSAGRLAERAAGGLCDVHFLPLVVSVGDSNRTQRLRCVGRSQVVRCQLEDGNIIKRSRSLWDPSTAEI